MSIILETEKKNIIIIGASGHAKVIIDIIEQESKYNIVGLIDSFKDKNETIFDYRILGTEKELPMLIKEFQIEAGIIAIGDNWTRKKVLELIYLEVSKFQFITAIHPSSIIGKNVKIGRGTVIMPGVVINSDAEIGEFCILNTKSSLGHDSIMEDFSSLAPNVCVGGNVSIRLFAALCLGVNVIHGIIIGKHTVIGAGALVNKNIENYKMAYGVPIKTIKTIRKGQKYLTDQNSSMSETIDTSSTSSRLTLITKKREWIKLLEEIDTFDFYHTYDYHMTSKSSGESPILLKYVENKTIIGLPLLIRNIKGTKYKDATSVYGYSGPVSKGVSKYFDNTNFRKKLLAYFRDNNIVSVFSRLNPYINNQFNILVNIGEIKHKGKVVNIDLTEDLVIQRQNYQRRLKTHVNKARKNCRIKIAKTEQDVSDFYEIYHENMDRVNAKKSYYFDNEYFQEMLNSQDFESQILLALDNKTGKVIAASQYIITNNIVQYHLSGTRNEYLHLMPTKLLIDEMRIIATKKGLKYFNLGGGLGGNDNDTLFKFKSSFSKDFKDFYLWNFIVNPSVYNDLVTKSEIGNSSKYFPLYRKISDLDIEKSNNESKIS